MGFFVKGLDYVSLFRNFTGARRGDENDVL